MNSIETSPHHSTDTRLAFDLECLIDRVGDRAHALSLIELFAEYGPQYIDDIKQACQSQDLEAVSFASHRLKGAAGMIEATEMAALAGRLESASQDGDTNAVNELQKPVLLHAEVLNQHIAACAAAQQR